jgi:hypothetical protein
MTKLEISKLEAAKRQLVTAVRLYFDYGDEVSIHTLAAASRNILVNLCEHRGIAHPIILDNLLQDFVMLVHHQAFRVKYREGENFLKHADRDPNDVLSFNPELTSFLILEGVEIFSVLSVDQVEDFHLYRGWWLLHNQSCLKASPKEFLDRLNGVRYTTYQRREYYNQMYGTIQNLMVKATQGAHIQNV